MWDLRAEIINAASVSNTSLDELSLTFSTEFRKKVMNKFPVRKGVKPYAVYNPLAWKWVGEFVTGKTILFFPREDEIAMFEIEHGQEVTKILENSFGFEFYLTNHSLDYLLFFNHHDYLIAQGTALEWLKNKIDKQEA